MFTFGINSIDWLTAEKSMFIRSNRLFPLEHNKCDKETEPPTLIYNDLQGFSHSTEKKVYVLMRSELNFILCAYMLNGCTRAVTDFDTACHRTY